MPDTINKSEAEAIKAAEEAYNALSDYEKSLVDKEDKKVLDNAIAALAELNKSTGTTSPSTGENGNMWLWIAILFASGVGAIGVTVFDRKKKYNR